MAKYIVNGRVFEVDSGKNIVNGRVFFVPSAAPAATSQPPQQTRKHYMKLLRL